MSQCLYRMQVNDVEMETFVSASKVTLFQRSDADSMFRCKLARYIVCCTVLRHRRPSRWEAIHINLHTRHQQGIGVNV